VLSYHYDVDDELDECLTRAEEFLAGGAGMVSQAGFYFYSALVRIRLASRLSGKEREDALRPVGHCLRLMRIWSESVPSTFQHKHDLIMAELARLDGDLKKALVSYEEAINGAATNGFTHEEAMANELFARFWTELGNDRFAGLLMREALSLYQKWGAAAKASLLTQSYPNLLTGRSILVDLPGSQVISHGVPSEPDVRTVLKASQDIAGEIELDSLLSRLMTDVIETTGAQKGYLLFETKGRWTVQAKASVLDSDKHIVRVHANLDQLLKIRSKALASAEAQVRTLFENSPLGIGLASASGRILSLNQSLMKMLGVTELEWSKTSMIDFYDDPKDRVALLMQVEKSGFVQEFGVRLVRPDGSKFDANLSMSQLVLEGNEVLLGMVQDVTAQITAEQETAVHEERARMARELHDAVTQTILSACLLADATVQSSKSGREIKHHDLNRLAQMLHGALDEMRTLLLDMRPDAAQNWTLGQMFNAMVESVRNRSPAKVSLRVEGDGFLPANVTAQLQRIAQESLNNAIWHAEASAIDIELVNHTDEGIAISVSDDGCGFDTEVVKTGHHGLEIMAERANEIGAVLKLTSEIGVGTSVSVTWS